MSFDCFSRVSSTAIVHIEFQFSLFFRNPSSDWIFLDPTIPRTRSDTFKNWVRNGTHNINGVAHFIALIKNIIGSRIQLNITPIDVNDIKVISLLLHGCDPGLINISFHNAVEQLVESLHGVKDELLEAVYQHIVFDFKIWASADWPVQIAHAQLLCTYIKDDPEYFSNLFHIGYFLNIVQQFYCRGPEEEQSDSVLTEIEERDLRSALLGNNASFINTVFFNVVNHRQKEYSQFSGQAYDDGINKLYTVFPPISAAL